MPYFDAAILGILQGLTEFLPVSSSGHLVLAQELLGVKQPGVTFELILHFGTLISVFIYFGKDILMLARALFDKTMVHERKIIGLLIIGTIPAGVIGLLFEDFFDAAFSSPIMTSVFLIVTGVILFATRFVRKAEGEVTIKRSIIIGLGQAMAILPGISRSGSTIAFGLFCGVKADEAARFSFLLAIPAVGGAILLKARDILNVDTAMAGQYLTGMILSLIFGLIAVYLVMAAVKRGRFQYFAYYCFAAGLTGLYLFS